MGQKRIVVTGGAGMLGLNLSTLLPRGGHQLVSIDRNRRNLSVLREVCPSAEVVHADLSEPGPWQEHFADADVVIDCKVQVAAPGPEKFLRNNVRATRHVLDACRRHGVGHIIHLSSADVISTLRDDYANSKRRGHALVERGGVPYTILMPALMYGCFDVKHLGYMTRIMELSPALPIPGSGHYPRQALYVMDMCRVIAACVEQGPDNRTHTVVGHEPIELIEMIRAIRKERRLRCAIVPIPLSAVGMGLRVAGALSGHPPFDNKQLDALQVADAYEVGDWSERFGVRYTPFHRAIQEIVRSRYYGYRKKMSQPH